MKSNLVLLLTACISPNGMAFTAVQDSAKRRSAYIEALNYYLKATKFRIVFCNNSGEDLSCEFSEYSDRIEFLSYYGNDYDKSLGKGYGEAGIIDFALQNSIFLKNAKTIVKITGKLKVLNLKKALSLTDFVLGKCDDCVCCTWVESGIVDSRVFCGSPHFFQYLVNHKYLMNDETGAYFEKVLHDCVCQYHGSCSGIGLNDASGFYCDFRRVRDFIIPLEVDGYSWTSGKKYYLRLHNKIDDVVGIKKTLDFYKLKAKNISFFMMLGGGNL